MRKKKIDYAWLLYSATKPNVLRKSRICEGSKHYSFRQVISQTKTDVRAANTISGVNENVPDILCH